jgi:hypothetical protein
MVTNIVIKHQMDYILNVVYVLHNGHWVYKYGLF